MYYRIMVIFLDFRKFNRSDKVTKMECIIIRCHVISAVIHKKEIAQTNAVLNSDIVWLFNVTTPGMQMFIFYKSDLKLEIHVFLLRSQKDKSLKH